MKIFVFFLFIANISCLTTFYVSSDGSGTNCTEEVPCDMQTALDSYSGGESTFSIFPGSYDLTNTEISVKKEGILSFLQYNKEEEAPTIRHRGEENNTVFTIKADNVEISFQGLRFIDISSKVISGSDDSHYTKFSLSLVGCDIEGSPLFFIPLNEGRNTLDVKKLQIKNSVLTYNKKSEKTEFGSMFVIRNREHILDLLEIDSNIFSSNGVGFIDYEVTSEIINDEILTDVTIQNSNFEDNKNSIVRMLDKYGPCGTFELNSNNFISNSLDNKNNNNNLIDVSFEWFRTELTSSQNTFKKNKNYQRLMFFEFLGNLEFNTKTTISENNYYDNSIGKVLEFGLKDHKFIGQFEIVEDN